MNKILRLTLVMLLSLMGGVSLYADEVTDELTVTSLGLSTTGTNYSDFKGKTVTSPAVYAGNAATNKGAYIQLRSNNSNSGIVSTTSGGKLKKVTITFNSSTANNRVVDVYGSNTAYTAASSLYSNSTQGTKIGSATKTSSTTTVNIDVTDNYQYVGIRSKSGALYLDKITIVWEASASTKTAPGLKWSESSVSIEKGSEFTAPTFSKTTDATVTFASDNEGVATVDESGNISLGSNLGKATITATAAETSTYAAGTASVTIEVYSYKYYTKATTFDSSKKYLIVAQRNDSTMYAYPLSSSKTFGYLSAGVVKELTSTIGVKTTHNDEFTFTANGTGYNIQDGEGRYYYQKGTYNTFNASSTTPAEAWAVEAQTDGTFKISYGNYYIQWGQGTYKTFGLWNSAQGNAVLPYLYVYDESNTTGVTSLHDNVNTISNENAPLYNLAGQRVGKDYRGVVIQNGKKRINK